MQGYEPSILGEYAGKIRGWFGDDGRPVVVTRYNNKGIVLDAREVAKECLRLWCDFLLLCKICDSITSHFRFSTNAFGQLILEKESQMRWARQAMDQVTTDIAVNSQDDE